MAPCLLSPKSLGGRNRIAKDTGDRHSATKNGQQSLGERKRYRKEGALPREEGDMSICMEVRRGIALRIVNGFVGNQPLVQ